MCKSLVNDICYHKFLDPRLSSFFYEMLKNLSQDLTLSINDKADD